jgi:hypothetical protein
MPRRAFESTLRRSTRPRTIPQFNELSAPRAQFVKKVTSGDMTLRASGMRVESSRITIECTPASRLA